MRLLLLGVMLTSIVSDSFAQNRFPTPVSRTDYVVGIEDVVTIPDSRSRQPPRISLLTTDPSGRLFANDQRGPLYSIGSDQAVTEYLDLRDYSELRLTSSSEAGFQSFAFHPQFDRPNADGFGRFYTIHSSRDTSPDPDFSPGGRTEFHTVLLEWRTDTPAADVFAPASPDQPYRELMRISQPFGNHNAGLIAFNSTISEGDADFGNLYVAVGDGGSGGDPQDNGQDPSNPLGALLRIDPTGSNSSNGRYGIVDDNVLAADGDANTLSELYAFGLRNPQRFGWDASNGNMYIADIGQNAIEEINLGLNGANYGWNDREGSFRFDSNDVEGLTNPVAEYDHTNLVEDPPTRINNRAVTVGEVARGTAIQELDGKLLLGDFPTGLIFTLDVDNDPLTGGQDGLKELQLVDEQMNEIRLLDLINNARDARGLSAATRTDLRFGLNTPGEVYITNKQDGVIRRLVVVPEPNSAGIAAFLLVAAIMRSKGRRLSTCI